jgi:hypothetical protein
MLPPSLVVKRVAFADALKEDCARVFAYAGHRDRLHYERFRGQRDTPLPDIGLTPVELWVRYGNQMRAIDPGIWIRRCFHEAIDADVVFVTDVRYRNEVDEIRARGGLAVRVDNPRAEKRHNQADTALACFTEWDGTVTNDGDLTLFKQRLTPVLNWITTALGERDGSARRSVDAGRPQ